jgi:hypothetical protein
VAEMKLVLARYDFSAVTDGAFSAPVILPVGRKIVKVTYYHVGMGAPYSSLKIMRVRAGETPEKLGNKSSTDSTGKPIPVDVPIAGDPVIRGAYRYYILVSVSSTSFFEGAKVVYRE